MVVKLLSETGTHKPQVTGSNPVAVTFIFRTPHKDQGIPRNSQAYERTNHDQGLPLRQAVDGFLLKTGAHVHAHLLIVGLAPGAHGANRTGRMFTGDSSGDWLFKALYETGFANQPMSLSRKDGLILRDVYISAPIRCAPPKNRPLAIEIANCSRFLLKEWELLKNIKLVLALGHIAFDVCLRYLYPDFKPKPNFQHGGIYEFSQYPLLMASYHPSRQNTQTGRLTWNAWRIIFTRIKTMLSPQISDESK